jgi:hypothetical protein
MTDKPVASPEQVEAAKELWAVVMNEPFNPKTDYGLEEIMHVASMLAARDAEARCASAEARVRELEEKIASSPKDGGSGLEPCPFCGKAPRPPEYYFMGSYWHMGCYDESHPVIEFRAYVPNPDNADDNADDKAARYVAVIASWNTRRYQARAPAIEAVVEAAKAWRICLPGLGGREAGGEAMKDLIKAAKAMVRAGKDGGMVDEMGCEWCEVHEGDTGPKWKHKDSCPWDNLRRASHPIPNKGESA